MKAYRTQLAKIILLIGIILVIHSCSLFDDVKEEDLIGTWTLSSTLATLYEYDELLEKLATDLDYQKDDAKDKLYQLEDELGDTISGSITFNEDHSYSSALNIEGLAKTGSWEIGSEHALNFVPFFESDIWSLDEEIFELRLKTWETQADFDGNGSNETLVLYNLILKFTK